MNPDDVKTVAEALLDEFWSINESGNNCYVECKYCGNYLNYTGWDMNPDLITHALDCPVLIAKDLLT